MLSAAHTWSLAAIAVVAGAAALWVLRRFSDRHRVTLAKRRLRAHLLELRLFADEPRLMFRAQKQLLVWNARYLALMLRPAAVMIVPMLLLLFGLDRVYGHRPLAAGESAIVTAEFPRNVDLMALTPRLVGRDITVETPGVRLPDRRQVYWRVRAIRYDPGKVALYPLGDQAGAPQWLELTHPRVKLSIFGYGVNWLTWFSIVTLGAMLALSKPFDIPI